MMRADIVKAIQDLLRATGAFSTVCGIGSDNPTYPLARVWANGCPANGNLNDSPKARIDLRVAVQVETNPVKDADGNTDESALYNLVDQSFMALHNVKLPGKGSQPLSVHDHPGLQGYKQAKPVVYLLQVSVRVIPASFSLT